MHRTRLSLDFNCNGLSAFAVTLISQWSVLAHAVENTLRVSSKEYLCWGATLSSSSLDTSQGVILTASVELCEERHVPRIARNFLGFDSLRTLIRKSPKPCVVVLRFHDDQLVIERPASSTLHEAAEKICAELR